MVSSIVSPSATQASYAPTRKTDTEAAPAADSTVAATDSDTSSPALAQSEASAATTRVGERLSAQADASRVQRAMPAASSSETTATDYIAEADTNSDKTVSDEERAVYDAKLRQQADEASKAKASQADPAASRAAEVRAAYGQDESAAPALDITA